MKQYLHFIILTLLITACGTPFQAPKTEIEIESSSYDEKSGYVHISTSASDPLTEKMEIVIPFGTDDKRIGLLRNVKTEDGGWFGSDKISFDVYIPAVMKEKLLPSLEKGKKVTIRGKAGFTQMMSASVEMNRDTYIRQMQLTKYKEQLKAMFEPAYNLLPTPRLIAEPGSSKMGGMPNLPSGIEWPTNDGRPMSFIMQLNLSDFRKKDELREGTLFLFMDLWNAEEDSLYDNNGEVAYKIIYHPGPGTLTEYRPFPDELSEYQKIEETALRQKAFSMLPDVSSASVRKLSLNETDQQNYIQLSTLFETMAFTDIFTGVSEYGNTRFLGYPETSTDLQIYCEMDEKKVTGDAIELSDEEMDKLTEGASRWRLLMQVDFDYSPLAGTGLSGKYYFMLKKKDIEKKKYEEAVMYFESYE